MVCGGFREGGVRRVELGDVDGRGFGAVLDAWCGRAGWEARELGELVRLAGLADRLQMSEAGEALEDVIVGRLSVGTCADVATGSRALGLGRLEEAGLRMVAERFEEVAGTAGYLGMEEAALGRVLEEEGLGVRSEERAYEGLVRWMKAGEGGLRGRGLLRAVRFGVMEEGYLATGARAVFPGEQLEWIEGCLSEAVEARAAGRRGEEARTEHLGAKGLSRRRGRGVAWERCEGGGGRRLAGHAAEVRCLAACHGRVCSGASDEICVWDGLTLGLERTLEPQRTLGRRGSVWSLASWEGLLLSGHGDGRVVVWNAATGALERVLDFGHPKCASAPAVCGSRLLSGSGDRSVRVWGLGDISGCARGRWRGTRRRSRRWRRGRGRRSAGRTTRRCGRGTRGRGRRRRP